MLSLIARRSYSKTIRPFEERNRAILDQHKDKRLRLAKRLGRPQQFEAPKPPPEPTIRTIERKLPSLVDSALPYHRYSEQSINATDKFETYYDPLFNPHLHEEKNRVDPDQEPFNAIYADKADEVDAANDYTKVRVVDEPGMWDYVERLARIKVAPQPRRRKANEPIVPLPSGYVPPPETPPDLPYFVARTRNHLLPVYYFLHNEPDKCSTLVKQISGDLWKLEEDLRTHLESLLENKRKILTSVQEPDERIAFSGRFIHEIVDWLHAQGF